MASKNVSSPFLQGTTLKTTDGWIAARKLCTAPTQQIADDIESKGLANWLDAQLAPESIQESSQYESERAALFPSVFTAREAGRTRDRVYVENYQKTTSSPYDIATYVIEAALHRMWGSRKQLQNVMALFWADLIASNIDKAPDGYHDYIPTLYDGALGRYKDLLWDLVNTQTISMFLDNHTNTRYALNENLGREIMELYSWGTEKGYTHEDVIAAATLMTGFRGDITTYGSGADPMYHAFGPVTLAGKTFANGGSTAQDMYATLRELTDYLAGDRLTGLRISRKLIQYFIGDELNTEALAQRLTDIYVQNDTDIRPVVRALVLAPEFMQSAGHTARRPWSIFCSLMASGQLTLKGKVSFSTTTSLHNALYKMWRMLFESGGGVPFNSPATDGYPLAPRAWMSSAHYSGINKFSRFVNYIDTWDGSDPSKFTLWSQPIIWSQALGITPDTTSLNEAAKILFTKLSGYEPDEALIEALVLYASNRTPEAVLEQSAGATLSQAVTEEQIKRMIEASLTSPLLMLA